MKPALCALAVVTFLIPSAVASCAALVAGAALVGILLWSLQAHSSGST